MPIPALLTGSTTRWLLLPVCFVAIQALANESYDLTFEGDGSFSMPHAGHSVHAAIVDIHADEVVAKQSDTISGTEDPAFFFHFSDVFEEGKLYDLHYWIDSNFGDGQEGVCDPVDIDHQWRIPLGEPNGDITEVARHAPGEQAPVCDTFE